MKLNENIAPFYNFLLAYISKENPNNYISAIAEKEVEIVFSKQFLEKMSNEKINVLLSTLSQSLSKDTLGSLVQKAMLEYNSSEDDLQIITGLTPSLLKDIKADMVFTNSIPVRSLVKLLKLLNITLDKAQDAIITTFEKLSTESKMFLTIPIKIQPSFRKGSSNNTTGFDMFRLKSDESYLYQNKEALDKYTKRLVELYSQI